MKSSVQYVYEWLLFSINYTFNTIMWIGRTIYEWIADWTSHIFSRLIQWTNLIFSLIGSSLLYLINAAKQLVIYSYNLLTNAFLQLLFVLLLFILALILLHLLLRLVILLARDTRKIRQKLAMFYLWFKAFLWKCWRALKRGVLWVFTFLTLTLWKMRRSITNTVQYFWNKLSKPQGSIMSLKRFWWTTKGTVIQVVQYTRTRVTEVVRYTRIQVTHVVRYTWTKVTLQYTSKQAQHYHHAWGKQNVNEYQVKCKGTSNHPLPMPSY